MQSGQSMSDGRRKTDGCCAGEVPVGSQAGLDRNTGERDSTMMRTACNKHLDGDKITALKSAEAANKTRAGLEKQCAVVKDMEKVEDKEKDLNLRYINAADELAPPVPIPVDGNYSLGSVVEKKKVSETQSEVPITKSLNSQTSGVVRKHGKMEEELSGKRADGHTLTSEGVGCHQINKNVVDSGKSSQSGEKTVPGNGDKSPNASCLSSGGTRPGSVTPSSNPILTGSSLFPSTSSSTGCTTSSGGAMSAASRRSSFFNDPSRAAESVSPCHTSSLSGTHIPVSLVSERAKQFERGIMRKSGIEGKSHSLDPPYSSDPLVSCNAAYEHLSPMHKPVSASRNTAALRVDIQLKPENHQDVGEVLPPECVWIRRTSNNHQSECPGVKAGGSHDAVLDQKSGHDSMPVGTPVAKAGNIQKLKAFFGETTPKIIEAKGGPRCVVEDASGGERATDGVFLESKKDGSTKCDAAAAATAAAQKSLTFDPASWALERMARGKKTAAWTLASRSHSSHASGGCNVFPKKSSTERDPSSSPKQKEHKTWKGKVAETFKRYGSGTTVSGGEGGQLEEISGTFGVPLELLPPSLVNEFVPSVVEMCTRIVEERGLDNQGIYRVPGNSGALNAMIEELNKDPHGLCMDSDKWQDVNLISSMLKMFLRKLPDSLITDELYEAVVGANRTENSERRMLKLKKLIHDLPEHNFETLRFLAQHLNKVASHEEINKMDAHNLAIVFGPTLVRPQDDTMVVMVRDMADQCRVVESIIVHCDWFFSSWDEDVYVPVDEEAEDATPISGMNQELLAKAERLAYPSLPRDSRCKEIVSSFLQAANRKIQSQRKRRKDVLEVPGCPAANESCPPKKFRKSNNANSMGHFKRYLSDRRLSSRAKPVTFRNFRSESILREAPLNLIRYPACSPTHGKPHGAENAQVRLFRARSLGHVETFPSQVSCVSLVRERKLLERPSTSFDLGVTVGSTGRSPDGELSTQKS